MSRRAPYLLFAGGGEQSGGDASSSSELPYVTNRCIDYVIRELVVVCGGCRGDMLLAKEWWWRELGELSSALGRLCSPVS